LAEGKWKKMVETNYVAFVNSGLVILLAFLSIWKQLPLRTRQGLAGVNLILALYAASVGTEWLGAWLAGWIAVLGAASICLFLFVRRQRGWATYLMAFGGLLTVLGGWAIVDVLKLVGYSYSGRIFTSNGVALVSAMSLLGVVLLWPRVGAVEQLENKRRARWAILLSALGFVGLVWLVLVRAAIANVYGLPLLAGLVLVLIGVVGRALPALRESRTSR
jgi:hypothetical protein